MVDGTNNKLHFDMMGEKEAARSNRIQCFLVLLLLLHEGRNRNVLTRSERCGAVSRKEVRGWDYSSQLRLD